MIRTQRLVLAGMALLAAVSAAPAQALADEVIIVERAIVAPAMSDEQQAEQQVNPAAAQEQQVNQAAADCEKDGGWFDQAAGICDANGVK